MAKTKTAVADEPDESAVDDTRPSRNLLIPVENLDDELNAERIPPEQRVDGVDFWFGSVLLLKFPDGSTYHIRHHGNTTIHDPELIEKLRAYSVANPSSQVFEQKP